MQGPTCLSRKKITNICCSSLHLREQEPPLKHDQTVYLSCRHTGMNLHEENPVQWSANYHFCEEKKKVFSYCLTAYIDLILHPTRKVNLWVAGTLTKSWSSILLGIVVVCLIPWFSTALNSLLGSWSCVGLNLLKLFQWITTIQEIICLETTHFLKEWKLWRLVNNNQPYFFFQIF